MIRKRIEAVLGVGYVFEKGRNPPRRATLGRLDLDYFSAEIGENLAG